MKERKSTTAGPQIATSTQPETGKVLEDKVIKKDAVFGEIQEGDTNYRTVFLPDPSPLSRDFPLTKRRWDGWEALL